MRTAYSAFWTHVVIAVLLHAGSSFAPPFPVDAYGNVMSTSSDETALASEAQSLEMQLRAAQGGGMPTSAAYPGAQSAYPPTQGYSTMTSGYPATVGAGYGYGSTSYPTGPTGMLLPQPPPPLPGAGLGGGGPLASRKTFGSVSARATFDLCTQIISQSSSVLRSTDAVFNEFCVKLESAFTYCNFSEVSQSNSEITPASLSAIAAKAAVVLVKNITDGIDSIQKNLMDIVLSETQATKKTSKQDRWKSAGWMLAAAASNRSFRTSLATDSSETNTDNPATAFWRAFGKVFSVQAVSRRVEMPTARGTLEWKEIQEEQTIISDLFKAARRLNSARNTGTLSEIEAVNFVLGTRAFTKILTQSSFANGSIGLQQLAFRIFNECIYSWIKDLSGAYALRHEFWIVAAEAFNIMYSGIIGETYSFPRNINIGGNHFGTDHIDFQQENGSISTNLKNTYLTDYEETLKKIADTFTMHFSRIGLFKGFFESVKPVDLVAQNESDLLVMMLCSEACEYSMNKTQAPNAAKLIAYFYEKGFSFNNKIVNWDIVTSGAACLTVITLNRLLQRTATSAAGNLAGDYNSVQLYQALQAAYATIGVASDRFPAVQKALAPMSMQLQKDRTLLQKYMSSKKALKTLSVPDIILTTAQQNGVRPVNRTTPHPAGYGGYGTAGYSTPGYGTTYGTSYGTTAGYPAAYQQQRYGTQPQMRAAVPMSTFNMGAIPQTQYARTGFAPTQMPRPGYPAQYGAPRQQYMAPAVGAY